MQYLKFIVKPSLFGFRKASANEDSGSRIAQRSRIYASIDDGFVGVFQKNATHWVHRVGLLKVHTEEKSVELFDVVYFSYALRDFRVV